MHVALQRLVLMSACYSAFVIVVSSDPICIPSDPPPPRVEYVFGKLYRRLQDACPGSVVDGCVGKDCPSRKHFYVYISTLKSLTDYFRCHHPSTTEPGQASCNPLYTVRTLHASPCVLLLFMLWICLEVSSNWWSFIVHTVKN